MGVFLLLVPAEVAGETIELETAVLAPPIALAGAHDPAPFASVVGLLRDLLVVVEADLATEPTIAVVAPSPSVQIALLKTAAGVALVDTSGNKQRFSIYNWRTKYHVTIFVGITHTHTNNG